MSHDDIPEGEEEWYPEKEKLPDKYMKVLMKYLEKMMPFMEKNSERLMHPHIQPRPQAIAGYVQACDVQINRIENGYEIAYIKAVKVAPQMVFNEPIPLAAPGAEPKPFFMRKHVKFFVSGPGEELSRIVNRALADAEIFRKQDEEIQAYGGGLELIA